MSNGYMVYKGLASGSLAYVSRGEASNAERTSYTGSNIAHQNPNTNATESLIFLHEYSHHLMMQYLGLRMNSAMQYLIEGKSAEAGRSKSESGS